jgi:hypothetical protein
VAAGLGPLPASVKPFAGWAALVTKRSRYFGGPSTKVVDCALPRPSAIIGLAPVIA